MCQNKFRIPLEQSEDVYHLCLDDEDWVAPTSQTQTINLKCSQVKHWFSYKRRQTF